MSARIQIMLPTFVAFAVCMWGIDSRQVWRDEHATWWAATLPLDALWRLLSNIDAVIAPYYMLMRGFMALAGESPLALRFPSALMVALSAGSLAWVGARLFSPRVGVFAGLLLAAVPNVSRYGQEARPYAFTLFFTVLSVVCLLWTMERPSARRFAVYSASVVLLGCAHLVALCSLAAHPILLFQRDPEHGKLRLRRVIVLEFAGAIALALLLLAPLAYLGWKQIAQISWTRGMSHGVLDLPRMLFLAPRVGQPILILGLCALIRPAFHRLFAGGWAILPLAFLLFTRDELHLFIHRYMLFSVPAWCLLAALALDDLGGLLMRVPRLSRFPQLRYAVSVLALALLARRGLHKQREIRRPDAFGKLFDYRAVADDLRKRSDPAHAIAFAGLPHMAHWARMAMQYELRDRPPLRDVFVESSAAQNGLLYAHECVEAARCLPADVGTLWLVTCTKKRDLLLEMPDSMAALLSEKFTVVHVASFHNIKLARFERLPDR